jgi:hypothetical protein
LRKGSIDLRALALATFLVVASASGGELRALCSAAKDLVSAGKAQEDVLITHPTSNDLAVSTIIYAAAKKRYVAGLRAVMPILIAIAMKRRLENAEVEEARSVFQVFGANEEEQVARATPRSTEAI